MKLFLSSSCILMEAESLLHTHLCHVAHAISAILALAVVFSHKGSHPWNEYDVHSG